MELDITLDGAAFAYRRAPTLKHRVTLRESTMRDSLMLGELAREQAAAFEDPKTVIAEIDHEAVGVAITDDIDEHWTEVRVAVHQAHRGNGYGSSIVATVADHLEATDGRLVCAGMHGMDERVRLTFERGGFRLVDYYFIGTRRR
jgi:GNAT superfamily N-acetyltransferase